MPKRVKKTRVAIIGHFGGNNDYNDGQTVKVRSLFKGLCNASQKSIRIDKVDTYFFKKNIIKFFFLFVKIIFVDKVIIFLPATNGRKVMFKLMYFLRLVFRKRVFHDCIGGGLVKELPFYPKWKKYLNSFNGNWMESQIQVDSLTKLGILNAKYIPNFKNIEPIAFDEIITTFERPYPFCTFSRVLPEKGIEDAIVAVSLLNKRFGVKIASLDIYGPIQNGDEEWFDSLLKAYKGDVTYCGNVNPDDSVSVLKKYFALLFPTRFYTEGMPGTIIDSFFSGLPVISRKWAYCDQMITNGYNGFSYDFDKPEMLLQILMKCVGDPNILVPLRHNCLIEAQKYTESSVISMIIKEIMICEK